MQSLNLPLRTQQRRTWLLPLGAWVVLAVVVVVTLWYLRQASLAHQLRELNLLTLASSDAVERGMRGVEEGLHVIRTELEEGHLSLDDESAARTLKTRVGLMPLVQSLWVIDDRGEALTTLQPLPHPDPASFHPPLASTPKDVLSLSRPFDGGGGEQDLLAFAVRYSVGQQGTSGWIIASAPNASLVGAIGGALPSTDASMLVLRSDSTRLVAVNALPSQLPPVEAAAFGVEQMAPGIQSFAQGDMLVAQRFIPRYGVKVVVYRDLAAALGDWRLTAELAAASLTLLLVAMCLALYKIQQADRRRAEAQRALTLQVSRSGKLESLGTLAGGVAHDFNNVLAGIVGYGEMAQDSATPGSAQARHIDKLLQAALRGKDLVERILTFSRGGARTLTVFEVGPLVEEVLTLMSASLRSGIELNLQIEAPSSRIKGDATQVFEAVMNLCTNAMQAMPNGGTLGVSLRRESVQEPRVLSHSRLARGGYVVLSVSDQGMGITPQVMEHLFEPFFTTKAAQSGTGLGLAVVFGVVAELGGGIDVDSSPGQGARFTVYLPECVEGLGTPVSAESSAVRGAGQRILVVDDEPELVALNVEMLRSLGYEPQGFTDARAALRSIENDPGRYAAVVTDEVMPELTGTQLTQALRQVAPLLPVLLVSGYGGALLGERASATGVTRVLTKPLQRHQLARALSDIVR
jgi:signal transduction histidine kinase/CheY-like chemotaxis protein